MVGAFIRNAPFGTEIAFKKGFDRLGSHVVNCIDTSYPNQSFDYDADATIVFKWMEGYWDDLEKCKGPKIVYQPDDLRFPHIQEMMSKMRAYCDYAFTFDSDGANLASRYGYKKTKRLLLTADNELYTHDKFFVDEEKDFDISFVGSLTGGANHAGRRKMIQVLKSNGFDVKAYTNINDASVISEIYNRSKIVLNHATDVGQQFGTGYGYQCRHFEVGFTKTCLLSNHVLNDRAIKNFAVFKDENDLVQKAKYLLENKDVREKYANDLYNELYDDFLPEHRAKEIIDFIGNL